jgi:hypothetical protein
VWSARFKDLALILASGWSLCASTNNAESFVVNVDRAGDL